MLTQSTPPPTHHQPARKREVQFVDHLNNALNNSTVIAAKKEPLQAWNRTNNWLVETANLVSVQLKKAASICMTNGTFVQGREGRAEAARGGGGHELGGPLSRCHRPAEHTTALSTAKHSTAYNGEGRNLQGSTRDGDARLHMPLCQMI